ncbi:AraC family transcriptional regulator [Marinifilum caeruleilacunae]|uniref:AraC family transcriptional regulator n=1 Tax=Marinifilum caeruleilacunae TaxID=2499076 RepID=A0ABX1WT26_9BACT|nr:AraC family transcriptional regulator [Marinifilum caeruleilacunae]NOU59074.1 AraC family transcriptional regulator [Marinifilum caeruleilacunae]
MQFKLDSFLAKPNDVFHLARITLRSKSDIQMHTHDYAEIFWIEDGEGFHLINGEKIKIMPGYLCMVRPGDQHTFAAKTASKGLTVTNLAFTKSTLHHFEERYFKESNLYFWVKSHLPFSFRIPKEELCLLSGKADQVINQPKDHIHLDRLLLFIFEILEPGHENYNSSMPYWLQYALENYNSPANFLHGVEGFLSLTNKSIDHTNRILKKYTGKTLTKTVNDAKIKYAARLLVMTDASIKTIASDSGYANMGYFYRVFKSQFKMSPKDYRIYNKKII